MAYLTLTFNDDRDPEVVQFDGEARIIASLDKSFTFGGVEGVASAAWSATKPADEGDDQEPEQPAEPATKAKK